MKRKIKTLRFDYPHLGFNLICFDGYMYLGDLCGHLPIEPRDVPFGKYLFEARKSKVIQIGDERGSALWEMLRMIDGNPLLYLGVIAGETGDMLVFQPLENDRPKIYNRNLFGDICDLPYLNLYVVFNYLSPDELHITTRNLAARVFRPTVVFV